MDPKAGRREYEMGYAFHKGGGRHEVNVTKAAEHYASAVQLGYEDGMSRLRELLQETGMSSRVGKKIVLLVGDASKALLQEMGLPAIPTLPLLLAGDASPLDEGYRRGIKKWNEEKYEDALQLFMKGAAQRHAPSLNMVGVGYLHGLGTVKSPTKAYICFTLASLDEQNEKVFPLAYYNRGFMIFNGLVPGNSPDQAHAFFAVAASGGEPKAYAALGKLYQEGIGVAPDAHQALTNYQKALELGELGDMEEFVREQIATFSTNDFAPSQEPATQTVQNKSFEGTAGRPISSASGGKVGRELISVKDHAPALDELDELIGLQSVKDYTKRLVALAWWAKERRNKGIDTQPTDLHMVFSGAPGTGKTTVAQIMSRIFAQLGVLSKGHLVEVTRADLVGQYLGQTAPRTKAKVEEAFGGTLFIDEAYALSPKNMNAGDSYGTEAIAMLLQMMEEHRDKFAVIVAGYPDEMAHFINMNPGLKSRFRHHMWFPDYVPSELGNIFNQMIEKEKLEADPEVQTMLVRYLRAAMVARDERTWGNAREVRNILKSAIEHRALSLFREGGQPSVNDLRRITVQDFAFLQSPAGAPVTDLGMDVPLPSPSLRVHPNGEEASKEGAVLPAIVSQVDVDKKISELIDQGDAEAMTMLAHMLQEGWNGREIDHKRALELFEHAAEKGHPVAARELGLIFERGLGVPKDTAMAGKWYQRAAELGDKYAKTVLANSGTP